MNNKTMQRVLSSKPYFLSLLFGLIANLYAEAGEKLQTQIDKRAKVAIIMDDIGAKATDSKAFRLTNMVTFGILPNTEYSREFSQWAYAQNREVILHMPMESLNGNALGEGAILSTMYPNEVISALDNALKAVPHAIGVNNHMGSKLTQLTLPMSTVMQALKDRGLFFIDSRTTKFTKAHVIAQRKGVQSAQRHIFIDHYANEAFIQQQLQRLFKKARSRGKAIGIAHPYPVTIQFLKTALQELPSDVELISVSEYFGIDKFRYQPERIAMHQIDEPNTSALD